MRLFLAIDLPDRVKDTIERSIGTVRSDSIRWVSPELLHVTLRFIGDAEPDFRDRLEEGLPDCIGRHREFEVATDEFGVFPNTSAPSVFWLGCHADPPLELLRHDLENLVVDLGLEPDGRPFRPHVTVGRSRRGCSRAEARRVHEALATCEVDEQFTCREVCLMNSVTDRSGPRYSKLLTARLAT